MRRYGSVIGVGAEKLEEYKKLHAAVWPDVLKMIKRCNIRNYSIYLRKLPDGNYYLFAYFEYTGFRLRGGYEDNGRLTPTTQKMVVGACEPCQKPLEDRAEPCLGEWWADMEEVFHLD